MKAIETPAFPRRYVRGVSTLKLTSEYVVHQLYVKYE